MRRFIDPSKRLVGLMVRHASRFVALCLVALLLVSTLSHGVSAAPGDLDPGFGSGGKVTTDFSGGDDEAFAIAMQSDGKIVVAGRTRSLPRSLPRFTKIALARYNPDGSLDPSFGPNHDGRVTTDFGSGANSVAIQADGAIVVAAGGSIFRYDANGNLDPTFGPNSDGRVSTGFDRVSAVAIQPDGLILAAGHVSDPTTGQVNFAVARHNPDGSLDSTFGPAGNGTSLADFGADAFANALAIQPTNGKIVLAGAVQDPTGISSFALALFNPNGHLDTSFGNNGMVVTPIDSSSAALAVAIQPTDGKIVAAGRGSFVLERYDPDGGLDESFGMNGVVTVFQSGDGTEVRALVRQADGKFVAAGPFFSPVAQAFVVVRFNSDGSRDTTYGPQDPEGTGIVMIGSAMPRSPMTSPSRRMAMSSW